jgi:asparagine synthase (glutamine-hydrolysing)
MCGIAGFTTSTEPRAAVEARLRSMVASLHHRGPDAQRAVLLDGVALGHTRLSIVDLASGHQPMHDPEHGLTVVFNGEIFNPAKPRSQLGHWRFRTRSDTEVILAAFDAWGIECVRRFVGQFAFALWDARNKHLWLARDRVGIRPLFYARTGPRELAFASEAKALFASGLVEPKLDACAIAQTLSLWAPVSPRSMFEGVKQLPPGHVALYAHGVYSERRYWNLDLSDELVDRSLTFSDALGSVDAALNDALRLRLRADVPVAAYLSGGLDSSLLCSLAQRQLGGSLQTFSVSFEQARFDERSFQREVADGLRTRHAEVPVSDADIGALLPKVVWHAEQVLLRSAPAPFFALSRLVRSHGTKVVLTGEGADEVFLGYDVFKETAVRRFWSRAPQSLARPRLFSRLYPYLPVSQQSPEVLKTFFGQGLEQPDALDFSHQIRWSNSGRVARFFSPDFVSQLDGFDPVSSLLATVPEEVRHWRPQARAQYLEFNTLLSGYLLSAQGDRMLMSNSVEGRFPFLDHRLIELSARLPDSFKLRGLDEKFILKRLGAQRVPPSVLQRTKFPYRAPAAEALVGRSAPGWSEELLGANAVGAAGVFEAGKVEKLLAKLRRGTSVPSEADAMALMAVTSLQLLWRQFIDAPQPVPRAHLDAVEFVSLPRMGEGWAVRSPAYAMRKEGNRPHEEVRAEGKRPHEEVRAEGKRPHEEMRAEGKRPHEEMRAEGKRPHEEMRAEGNRSHENLSASEPHS